MPLICFSEFCIIIYDQSYLLPNNSIGCGRQLLVTATILTVYVFTINSHTYISGALIVERSMLQTKTFSDTTSCVILMWQYLGLVYQPTLCTTTLLCSSPWVCSVRFIIKQFKLVMEKTLSFYTSKKVRSNDMVYCVYSYSESTLGQIIGIYKKIKLIQAIH